MGVPGHAPAELHFSSCALSYWCGRDGVVPWMGADGFQDEGWLRSRLVREHRGPLALDQGQAFCRGVPQKGSSQLNNGRLAMLACIGLWAQELVQGGQPVMFTLLEKVATYEIPALFQEFHQ